MGYLHMLRGCCHVLAYLCHASIENGGLLLLSLRKQYTCSIANNTEMNHWSWTWVRTWNQDQILSLKIWNMNFIVELWRTKAIMHSRKVNFLKISNCKPKGSQAIKSIKETGDIGSFPLLYLEIGAKLQCVYLCVYMSIYIYLYICIYAVCYLYDGIFFVVVVLAFSLCCLIVCSSCHMYFIIRQAQIADPSEKHCRSIPTIFMVVWWWEKSALVSSLPPFF